ncbi:MAG: hypothetical protein R2681_17110 [Pyrinomonadaceae bacterium]
MNSINHRKTLAILFFVLGGLNTFVWFVSAGWLGGEWFTAMYAAVFLITGWKLHHEKEGVKVFGIVSSLLCLPAFPIGTIIGIYGLWYFLLNENS